MYAADSADEIMTALDAYIDARLNVEAAPDLAAKLERGVTVRAAREHLRLTFQDVLRSREND